MVVGQDKGIDLVPVVHQKMGQNVSSVEEQGLLRMYLMVDQKEFLEEHHDSVNFDLGMEVVGLHILVETSLAGCCTYHEHLMKVVVQVHLEDRQEDP